MIRVLYLVFKISEIVHIPSPDIFDRAELVNSIYIDYNYWD